ncbi:MAG: glycosyltransferase family 2 protein [Chloroflexi bacterium]|nr:glycosyltransferase family 2 protein [Chloroflexota bacterium]
MTRLSVIVPTYNEAENLPFLVERVHAALCHIEYELIVVDDNSPDGTGTLAEELARKRPIKVVHRAGKMGLASAVIDGFKHASGDILGVIDADLQHPPEKIPDLLAAMGKADIVVASRYVKGGGTKGWTFTREFISRGAKVIPQFLFAKIRSVKDPLSGFFLFRRDVIKDVTLNPIGYKILLEILVKGKHNGIVAEVPYVFGGRERGQSTFNRTEQINYLKHLWRLIRSEKEVERFAKFCLVGASGVLVNMAVYWILERWVGIKDTFAQPISVETAIISNFALNEVWTFRDRRLGSVNSLLFRMLKFNLICGAGAALNFAVFYFLTRGFELYDMVALLIAIIVAMLFNFILNKWWTWK